MDLLLHVCCAPCSLLSWKHFVEKQDFNVTGYFFNPNIHPYREFKKRKETLRALAAKESRTIIIEEEYLLDPFLKMVVGREVNRCLLCYEMRLKKTAQKAKETGFNHFSTTLLVSPYQNHDLIRQTGQAIAKQLSLNFVCLDLRSIFKESIALSRERGIYTQSYCGCIYSEKERYART